MNIALLVIILVGGTILAGGFAFMMFYMTQMRSSDRISYREIHEFIARNSRDIADLKRSQRRSEGDEPGD